MNNRTEQRENNMDWLHAWLHQIHAWDEPGRPQVETMVSVRQMEQLLTRELVRRFEKEMERGPMFYHDHDNGGVTVCVDKDFSIEPSRAGLLRVIGCGHFLLSFYKQAIDATLSLYGHRKDLEWATSYLRDASSEWEAQPLRPNARCDPSVGIGDYFNRFARGWLKLNTIECFPADKHMKALFTQWSGIKFLCKTKCFSNLSEDQLLSTANYRRAYKEFLYLHICCIVEHDGPQPRDSILLHQYRLLNRISESPSLQLEPQTVQTVPSSETETENLVAISDYSTDLQLISSSNNDALGSEKTSNSSRVSETTGRATVETIEETRVIAEKSEEIKKTSDIRITETRESNLASLKGTSESSSATGNKVTQSQAVRRSSATSISSKTGEKSTTSNKISESQATRRGSVTSISSKTGEKSTTSNKVSESQAARTGSVTSISSKTVSESQAAIRGSVTSISSKTGEKSTTGNKVSESQAARRGSVSSTSGKTTESTSTTQNKISVSQTIKRSSVSSASGKTESTSTTVNKTASVSQTTRSSVTSKTSITGNKVSASKKARRSSVTSASGKTVTTGKKKSVYSMKELNLDLSTVNGEPGITDATDPASKQNTKTSAVVLSGKRMADATVLLKSKTTKQWLEEFNKTTTSQWNRSENFDASSWTQTKDGREAKVVEQHWKLGCLGCPEDPDGAPPPKFKGAKGNKCCSKWVIVKTAVLVRVPAKAEKILSDAATK